MKAATTGSIKFVASSSSATGQNAILGKGNATSGKAVIDTKFGKAQEERKSPSAERGKGSKKGTDDSAGKTDGEWNIEEHVKIMGLGEMVAAGPGDPTQGCTQAETEADEDMTELGRKANDDNKAQSCNRWQ